MILLTREPTAHSVDDEVLGLQKLIGNLHRCLQVTTSVLLEVKDKIAHALLAQ